ALTDRRYRHELRILQRRMRESSRCQCAHWASLWPAGCDKRAIHSRSKPIGEGMERDQTAAVNNSTLDRVAEQHIVGTLKSAGIKQYQINRSLEERCAFPQYRGTDHEV